MLAAVPSGKELELHTCANYPCRDMHPHGCLLSRAACPRKVKLHADLPGALTRQQGNTCALSWLRLKNAHVVRLRPP